MTTPRPAARPAHPEMFAVLGLTTAARHAPILLLSPYAGLLVDRYAACCWSRRRASLSSRLSSELVLTGDIRIWQVVVFAVLFGMLSAADNPARQAFVQEIVGRSLTTGNATIQLASDPEYRGRVTALWSMALLEARRSAHRSSARCPTWPARGAPSASAPSQRQPPSSSAADVAGATAQRAGPQPAWHLVRRLRDDERLPLVRGYRGGGRVVQVKVRLHEFGGCEREPLVE
jgi:hypothetical protein